MHWEADSKRWRERISELEGALRQIVERESCPYDSDRQPASFKAWHARRDVARTALASGEALANLSRRAV